jgi:hypothetical protein
VLIAQCIGSLIICGATFALAMTVFGVLNLVGLLRISKDGEVEGMDLHEHGISAYPEYVIAPSAAPAGMPPEMVNTAAFGSTRNSACPWRRRARRRHDVADVSQLITLSSARPDR